MLNFLRKRSTQRSDPLLRRSLPGIVSKRHGIVIYNAERSIEYAARKVVLLPGGPVRDKLVDTLDALNDYLHALVATSEVDRHRAAELELAESRLQTATTIIAKHGDTTAATTVLADAQLQIAASQARIGELNDAAGRISAACAQIGAIALFVQAERTVATAGVPSSFDDTRLDRVDEALTTLASALAELHAPALAG